MAWAPRYQGEDLAMVRGEIRRAQVDADRARRDAQAADTDEARQRLAERAAVAERWEQMTRDVADRLAEAQAGYDTWAAATGPGLPASASAADAELRRRHPDARSSRCAPSSAPSQSRFPQPRGQLRYRPPQRPAAAANRGEQNPGQFAGCSRA
jgi:hypothetical protein